jgi:hypothetical protein
MISSKAGTTLPDALTLTSIVPLSMVESTMSFRLTLLCMKEMSKAIQTTMAAPMLPYFMNLLLRSFFRTSFGISLSISDVFLFSGFNPLSI